MNKYLVPINILYEEDISEEFLMENNLEHYVGMIQAIKTGDIKLYQKTLDENEHIYLQQFTFLFVEKFRLLVL